MAKDQDVLNTWSVQFIGIFMCINSGFSEIKRILQKVGFQDFHRGKRLNFSCGHVLYLLNYRWKISIYMCVCVRALSKINSEIWLVIYWKKKWYFLLTQHNLFMKF